MAAFKHHWIHLCQGEEHFVDLKKVFAMSYKEHVLSKWNEWYKWAYESVIFSDLKILKTNIQVSDSTLHSYQLNGVQFPLYPYPYVHFL